MGKWKVVVRYDNGEGEYEPWEEDDEEETRDWEVSVCKKPVTETWGWDSPDNKWILYSGGVGGQEWCKERFEYMKKIAQQIADDLNKRGKEHD